MSNNDMEGVCQRLDTLIKLMVADIVIEKKYDDQVWMLSLAGFQPKEIADFLKRTPNAISLKLTELRKKIK